MIEGSVVSYRRVFVRNWWRWVAGPRGIRRRVPHPGRQTTIGRHLTYDEARRVAREYNESHDPGPLSRKAEFERER